MLLFSILLSWATAAIEIFSASSRLIVIIPYGIVVPLYLCWPWLAHRRWLRSVTTPRWRAYVERLHFFIFILNAPASLWFHKMGFQYDRFLHFMVGVALVPLFYLVYVAIRRRYRGSYRFVFGSFILLVSFLGIMSVFGWELYQHTVDTLFGTNLFFDSKQPIVVDFWEDIFFGLSGMCMGFYVLHAVRSDWEKKCFDTTSGVGNLS